jgi:hypothetical protein
VTVPVDAELRDSTTQSTVGGYSDPSH